MNTKKVYRYTLDDLYSYFKNNYGEPECVVQSPGRVNIIGEHTDYNGGLAIPFACNKYIWFIARKNNSNRLNVHAANLNDSKSIDISGEGNSNSGFERYFKSILKVLSDEGISITGIDFVFGGDLPVGVGMSSSSSLSCGFLYLLNTMFDLGLTKNEIVDLASVSENKTGVEGGKMDQITILHGKKDHALLIDFYYKKFKYLSLNKSKFNFALIDSKTKHSLVETDYNSRRKECQQSLMLINERLDQNKKIRHLDSYTLNSIQKLENVDRLKYVISENDRVVQAISCIKNVEVSQLGKLLYESHNGLSKLYNVSCQELDFIINECSSIENILGARMMGGGFGGCAFTLLNEDFNETELKSLKERYHDKFSKKIELFSIESTDGCKEI